MTPRLTEEQLHRNRRGQVLALFLTVAFLCLTGRLLYLQYWNYAENSRLSDRNWMRQNVIGAERGVIYDSKGVLLVTNRPAYHVAIVYERIEDSAQLVRELLTFKDSTGKSLFDSALVTRRIAEGRWRKYAPMRIYEDASIEFISLIEEHLASLPGVITQVDSRRDYPFGNTLAHVLGYTAEVTSEEFDTLERKGYAFGDRIGRKGVEQYYERLFKGVNGMEYIRVDAKGRNLGPFADLPGRAPEPGIAMDLTIDIELQKVAEEAFPDSLNGAVVAIDPQNGAILAMVSKPDLNPNIFSMDKATLRKEWAQVALNSSAPLNNRAITGIYPPGSGFKFFTAIAGMEYLGIDPNARPFVPCVGGYKYGNRFQRCWKSSGHGNVNMFEALRSSCDVYFYQLGLRLGMDKINAVSRMYGLGMKSGLDLYGEKSGLLMDEVTYNKRFKRLGWRWTNGQILNLAIGQGELVTPLQMANSFAALVHGRNLYQPHVLKSLRLPSGKVEEFQPKVIQQIRIKPETQRMIIQALEEVVAHPGGTGVRARVPGIRVGGKTGSAELGGNHDKTHAWFTAVAPLDNPRISVAVIVEQAGHGGDIAAPIVGKILRHYFKGTSAQPTPSPTPLKQMYRSNDER